jgi:hypothetical protein
LTATGSGTGPPGVGCWAGDWTVNFAMNCWPLMRIFLPFRLSWVVFVGVRVSSSVPVPGMTNGGVVQCIGAFASGVIVT